jgi:hypothetical protein
VSRHASFSLTSLPPNSLALPRRWKRLTYVGEGSLPHYRTSDGVEIDFNLKRKGRLTPIEVKYTDRPTDLLPLWWTV